MGHQPYETWLISGESLPLEDERKLHAHIESCESCRQLSISWAEVQGFFREPQLATPSPGFTGRWQIRLDEYQFAENERRQRRLSWIFFAVMASAATLLLGVMVFQLFSSVQTPVEIFIGGLTLMAGVLNLASAMQIAIIPFLNVILVSVPTYWWFILVIAACLLTLALTLSARRYLSLRRVSL